VTLKEAQAQLAGLRAQAEAIESEMRADRNGLEAYRKSSGVAIDQARARASEGKARATFDEEQAKARKGLAESHFISGEAFRQARAQAEQSQAGVDEVRATLARRCEGLGVGRAAHDRLATEAFLDDGWARPARFDAALRLTTAMVRSKVLNRGAQTDRFLTGLCQQHDGPAPGERDPIPDGCCLTGTAN
jgi:hypothetical protein